MKKSISSKHLTAEISDTGAELSSLTFNGNELIWQGKQGFWTGKAPLLFPICGFLKEGRYLHKGKEYLMDVHGFAKDSLFKLISKTNTSISLQLTDTEKTLEIYPFPFVLIITYTLENQSLTVDFEVTNTGTETLPFSIGWHPGFNITCPSRLSIKGDFINRRVEEGGLIGSPQMLVLDEEPELTPGFFNDGGIVLQKTNESVSLHTEKFNLTMIIHDFPALVLWGQPGADFICIEPWNGMGDPVNHNFEFTEKEGLIFLPPGDTFRTEVIIEVK